MIFVKIVYYILTIIALSYTAYFGISGLLAFKKSKVRIRKFNDKTKFAVLIAARNEENVVGSLIESLKNQNYDKNLYDIYTLVNNTTDDTAGVASRAGAKVINVTGNIKCKGDVLKFAFAKLKNTNYDAYVVFDADNVVHPDFLHVMNNIYQSGYKCAQGRKDSKNMDNWISTGYSLFYAIQNLFFNKARTNVKLSATINGTGFMIDKNYIDAGFNPVTVTEDIELSILCILDGIKVVYTDDAITYDESPNSFKDSWNQRKRWSIGIMQCCKIYNKRLLRKVIKEHDYSSFDKIIFNIAPYIQVMSIIPFILLGIIHMQDIQDGIATIMSFDYTGLIIGYFLSIAISIYTLQYYNKSVGKNVSGIALFIVFVLSWVPINFICLNHKKAYKWVPIKHDRNVELSSLMR
ncbi:MAG TPA: glycosyltransferase family 2 protein [Bacilli bacterium]|jgi:cellulose synthase/poly-beta-1,6-N-acetylglucosamine synthase-like glycosyltransferase|nr:glycosyltransferase family 2 protein [Bacilli bacterium]